jgi:hypothetical protein
MPTRKDDEKRDRALEDSFPASDPPANSGITGTRATSPASRRTSHGRDPDSSPKGIEPAHQAQPEEPSPT